MEKRVVKISVRYLVEFILRSGDLDRRRGSLADKEAMQKGSRLHRKIQGRMGGGYQAEVPLAWEQEYERFTLRLEGRADGIIPAGKAPSGRGVPVIDEIKGVFRNLDYLEEPVGTHLAQAKCYACIYAQKVKCREVAVQMTYCNMETEQIRRFRSEYDADGLFQWFQELIASYYKWADYQVRWQERRDASMQGLEFPFPYRPGQREIVRGVYHTIAARKQLFVQAPTGVGKTMSALFPAVRAMGEGLCGKIFYLTAKTVTRTVVEGAVSLLRGRGLLFQALTLTAREKICFRAGVNCSPEECPYAKGHFDRVNDAVYELWISETCLDREAVEAQARKWQVCPYEMSLDLAGWVDGIICDYNYVFDPDARLRRFFGDGAPKGDTVFLIDEAHNLVERGRDMYSAQISLELAREAQRKFRIYSGKLERYLGGLCRELQAMKEQCQTYQVLKNAGNVPACSMNIMGELEILMEDERLGLAWEVKEELLDFYFVIRDFLNILELVDGNYVIYTRQGEDGFWLKLFCVNPSGNLQNCLDKGIGAVFFSATLYPMSYYRSLFSRKRGDYAVCVKSPFSQKNRCLCIGRDVSSRYARRGQEEYRKIASYICCMAASKTGNYLAFFPSYQMQQEVFLEFLSAYAMEPIRCVCQKQGMGEGEREEFLRLFQGRVDSGSQGGSGGGGTDMTDGAGKSLVGFCIMGGIFSEGIDLIGDSLIGVLVVGTGIPQVSYEREILKAYYDRQNGQGFDYAYRYPGMNKVLQAAGRVIRTPEDKGVILLLDDRFLQQDYRRLFPEEWSDYAVCSLGNVGKRLREFWEKA